MHRSPSVSRRAQQWLALGSIVGVTAALAACAPAAPANDEPTTLTIAVGNVHQPHDPALGGLWYEAFETLAVMESLGYWDFQTNSLVPVLAESFEVAADGMSMEVILRQDVDFVDGTHLDAEGAVKFFDYLMASEGYELKGAVAKYEPAFEVTGDYSFEITTAIPIYLPVSFGILFQTPLVSPATLDASSATEAIGSGPYVIDEFETDVQITLVRNPDYRDPDAYPFDKLVLRVFADPVAKLNALKSGQVDATDVPVQLAAEAEAAGFTIQETSLQYVFLSVQDPTNSPIEALRDVRVRQAIMYAFDREAIAENVYQGLAEPAYQPYLPTQLEHVDGADDDYSYDVDKARSLMSEAGYADGFDVVLPSDVSTKDIEAIVQQSLAEIGIRVSYEVPTDSYFAALIDGRHPMTLGSSIYGNTTRLLDEEFVGIGRFFLPTPEVVELLSVIRGADPEAAEAASAELGQYLHDELWHMPIVETSLLWATIPEVAIDSDPAWGLLLRDFELAE